MPNSVRGLLILLATAIVAGGAWFFLRPAHPPVVRGPASEPAAFTTAPATTSQPVEASPPRSFLDLIRRGNRGYPATQPLRQAIDLSEAARVVLADPIYLCSMGHLWITRADAPATSSVLAQIARPDNTEQVHFVRDNVVFVHWAYDGSLRRLFPHLLCRREDGSMELVSRSARRAVQLQHEYQWDRAFSWTVNEETYVVAPTNSGVGVLKFVPDLGEIYADLLTASATQPTPQSLADGPQITLDTRGFLTWIPWENGRSGSRGALRFVDGAFQVLGPQQGWPEKILHLVPLLDGSVLQLIAEADDGVKLAVVSLDAAAIDRQAIAQLVQALDDPDVKKRQEAQQRLTLYGPGAWPILERYLQRAGPEMQIRLKQILAAKIQPTLGAMSLIDDKLRTVARLPWGGVVFYANAGASLPRGPDEAEIVTPAWIAMVPGTPVGLLPEPLVRDLKPEQTRLDYWPPTREWIISDDVAGPQRYIGLERVPLLKKSERQFDRFAGIDAAGRWIFRTADGLSGCLILDPHLPSLKPRLPGWEMTIATGSVGWDRDDWPAIKRGGAWALHESEWQAMEEAKNPLLTEVTPPPHPVATTTSGPATQAGPPLLIDREGNRYYDGLYALRRLSPDGQEVVWPLPNDALGTGPVTLLRVPDGRLFLFNQPGRVVRIHPTGDLAEPFVVEGIFSRHIPSGPPRRLWVDPAGRICVVEGADKLTILFPEGHIPQDIAVKMPTQALKEDREE